MKVFPDKQQNFLINGPSGGLEVLTSSPSVTVPDYENSVCVICHPHPQHGGTMHNKVVYTLAKVMDELGVKSVRFNYRGVGQSAGEYDHGEGEQQDLLAIVDWVRSVFPDKDIWLGGFSFGGFVSLKASAQIKPKQIISIAPAAGHPYFKNIPEIDCPWVYVQGEEDDVVLPQNAYEWIASIRQKPTLIRMDDAGHFFHGKLIDLKQELLSYFANKFSS